MKHFIQAVCMAVLLTSCAEEKATKNLVITGNIAGLKKGTLYLNKIQDSSLVVVDSIVVNGSSAFRSEIDIESPEMFYMFLDRGATTSIDNSLMLFVEPGVMNIETTLDQYYANAKVTGSKNHDLYEEYKKVNSRFNNQQLDLMEEKLTAMQKGTAFSETEFEKKSKEITKRRYLYAINFAVTNKDAEIAPYIALAEISDAQVKYLDTINKVMTPKVAKSKYGKMLTEYVGELKKLEK
ncbi:MAG: DUF4369 domain-containing protein [Flavobacterium sp.]|nr:DUF4369 domain-containing protein [Flavobacterium sp.]